MGVIEAAQTVFDIMGQGGKMKSKFKVQPTFCFPILFLIFTSIVAVGSAMASGLPPVNQKGKSISNPSVKGGLILSQTFKKPNINLKNQQRMNELRSKCGGNCDAYNKRQ